MRYFAKHQAWSPDGVTKWNPEHARALKTFLESEEGKVLAAFLREASIAECAQATQAVADRDHACGYASGFRGAVAMIDSLAAVKEFDETEDEGALQELEHLRP